MFNGIVRKRRVSNAVGTTEKHLERNVGNELAHAAKTVPWVFVQEAHGNVKGGTTPALEGVEVGKSVASLLGNCQEIDGTNTSSQE